MNKYNFVYKTTNNLNGNYYYGVHSTNDLNDGYLGSGKLLKQDIKKFGKENFTKEILKFFNNHKDALTYEKIIITRDSVFDTKCYNMVGGGRGGNALENKNAEERKIIRKKQQESKKLYWAKNPDAKDNMWSKFRKANLTEDSRKRIGAASKERGKGRVWINKNNKTKWINKSELDLFLNNGWQMGRLKKLSKTDN